MRAPAPSLRPMSGAPTLMARSITLWIFSANTSPRAPPKTVKSWREDEDLAAVDRAPAGDDAVGVGALEQAAVVGPVAGEHVELVERAVVEQVLDALAGEHLALGVLALDGPLGAGVERLLLALGQLGQPLAHRVLGHRRPKVLAGLERRPT